MAISIKHKLIALFGAAAAILAGQPSASAILVGVTPGGPHFALSVNPDAVVASGFTDSWTLGSEQAPVSIDYLATNGFALTILAGSPALQIGQLLQLHEFIKIGDNSPSWTTWNQRFVTDGFNFNSGTLQVNGNLVTNGIVSMPDHQTINFNFAALPAGTVLEITKTISWMGNPGGNSGQIFQGAPDEIQFEQFPTVVTNDITPPVPEPASLALVGIGASLLGFGKSRKSKKTA